MRRVDSLEKTLMLGGIGGRRRKGRPRMRWLDGVTDSMDMSLSELRVDDGQGGLACCSSWGHKELDTTELNWTEQYRGEALVVNYLPANAEGVRDPSSIPGSGRSPAGGHGNPLQYLCLINPTDRRAWQATVHRVVQSQTWLKWLSMHACSNRKSFHKYLK